MVVRFPFGEMRKFWKYDSGAGSPTRRLSRMPLNRNFKTVNVMLCVFYPIFFFLTVKLERSLWPQVCSWLGHTHAPAVAQVASFSSVAE